MLKYIKNHVDSIEGIEIYPLISLVLFVAFLIGLFIWCSEWINAKEEISNYPLKD